MNILINLIGAGAFMLASLEPANAAVVWTRMAAEQLPKHAILGGVDQTPGLNSGAPLFLCNAAYAGNAEDPQLHPGKLIGGRCNIGYGGKEIELDDFEIAVGEGSWDRRGTLGALIGGHENGAPLYVCRIKFADFQGPIIKWDEQLRHLRDLGVKVFNSDRGWHPGKLLPSGHCNIGYGGAEHDSEDYELFYPS